MTNIILQGRLYSVFNKGDFGGASGSKFIANGKAYKPYRDKQSVELVQGIVTECIILDIRDVPNTINRFDRIELDWYFNPAHHSGAYRQTLDFYNVPVTWE
ncbi:MAG: hypothetical protein LBI60_06155 [Bacteroidales bacterium]|jgi:hypothetical protein|nr:hypothetical protein [Bacteroidales bacterium]